MRPKIKVSLKAVDIILEVMSISVFALLILYLCFSWLRIPAVVPTHFGISGKADAFGSKNSILFLLPVILILYAGLTVLQKFPHIYNYAVNITEKNAHTQYTYAVRMLRALKLVMVLLFSYIEFSTIRSAVTGENSLGILFLPVFLVCVFGTLGVYIWKSVKASNK